MLRERQLGKSLQKGNYQGITKTTRYILKRISYGLRNVEVYWRKMLLGFAP